MSLPEKPPIFTLISELLSWSMDCMADFPKIHHFTIGQRVENFTLDALERCLEAIYAPVAGKRVPLLKLDLLLEKLRVLWRIAHQREWLSQQELFFVIRKVDEIGRMVGAWVKTLPSSSLSDKPLAGGARAPQPR